MASVLTLHTANALGFLSGERPQFVRCHLAHGPTWAAYLLPVSWILSPHFGTPFHDVRRNIQLLVGGAPLSDNFCIVACPPNTNTPRMPPTMIVLRRSASEIMPTKTSIDEITGYSWLNTVIQQQKKWQKRPVY
jgi:hypothetical protein